MKFMRLLLPVAITALSIPALQATDCPTTEPFVIVLKRLNEREWRSLSKGNLQSMWPSEAGSLDCDDAACKTLSNKGKVSVDKCECCMLFNFDADRDDKGVLVNEHLYSFVIYSSASGKNKAQELMRTFAKALGAPDGVTSTISGKQQQHLYWNLDRGKNAEVALMETNLTRHGKSWRVYIHFSRHQA